MDNRVAAALWLGTAALAVFAAVQALSFAPENAVLLAAALVIALVALVGQFVPGARRIIGVPARWLRRRPILYWLALLVYVCVGLGAWVVSSQPTNGRALLPSELGYLLALLWGLLYLLFFDLDRVQLRDMGGRLSKSRLSGLMVTLTTLVFILIATETYLRLFYITTDGFGFTAMNYYWYQNFYQARLNSLGYRDAEPKPDAPGLVRVAVVGDSFAMGHGINNLDDTFPQILERDLGDGYDVNVVAKSGWDADVELSYLMQYPLRSQIVVLSYYLNDIDWLLQAPERNPDSQFSFPENPALAWVVIQFFTPNYIYYNLLQFTSPARTTNHLLTLVDAHLDDTLWSEQSKMLDNMVWWTNQNGAKLIVLLWPHITQVDASAPALARVEEFFAAKGVPVVDMSASLREHAGDPALIVNRFDTHPGLLAQRLAAGQLAEAIRALP